MGSSCNNVCTDNSTVNVTVKKNRLGVDDLLFGCGNEEQKRCGVTENVEAINASHIVCCDETGKMTGKNMQDVCDAVHEINPYIGNCDIGARNKLEFREWDNAKIPLNPVDGNCDMNLPENMYQRVGFENQDGTCHDGKSWISTMCTLNYNEPNQMAVHNRQWFPFDYLYDMYECMFPQEMSCDMNEDNCTEFTALPTLCDRVSSLEAEVDGLDKVDNFLTNVAITQNASTNVLKYTRNGDLPPLSVNVPRDKVTALTVSGTTLTLQQSSGDSKSVSLPSNKVNSLTISGNTLTLNQDIGGSKSVSLPSSTPPIEPTMKTKTGSASFTTTYSPNSYIKLKQGTSYFSYTVQSKGVYTINVNLMLRYVNSEASQHELDYLRLGHVVYIRRNGTAIAIADMGSSSMGKCKPRMSTSGSVHWTGMLNAGDKIEFYKKTYKCDTAPAKNTLNGFLNYAITQIQVRS